MKYKLLAILGALLALWGGVFTPLDHISVPHLILLGVGLVLFARNIANAFFGVQR